MKLKRWRVSYQVTFDGEVVVEAKSEADACDLIDCMDLDKLYEGAWGSVSSHPVIFSAEEEK
jgi:hypothetical protein